MTYVIRRKSDSSYIAAGGSAHSYTSDIMNAKIYESKEDAIMDWCPGKEVIWKFNGLGEPLTLVLT
jgi:hypothetical protein